MINYNCLSSHIFFCTFPLTILSHIKHLLTYLISAVRKTHKAESTAASTHVKEKEMFGLNVLMNKIKQKIPTFPVTLWWFLWYKWWRRWHWWLAWAKVSEFLWGCICFKILWYYTTAVYCTWRDRWNGAWDMCTSREFIVVPRDVKWKTWSNYPLSLWHNESSNFSNTVASEWTHASSSFVSGISYFCLTPIIYGQLWQIFNIFFSYLSR